MNGLEQFDPQIRQMGSLLSRMEGGKKDDLKLSRAQVASLIEVFIPRLFQAPGMPDGISCNVSKTSDDSWTIEIARPKS